MKPLATLTALATTKTLWAGAANAAAVFVVTALALAVIGQPAAAGIFTVGVGSSSVNGVGGCSGGGRSSGSSPVSISGVCSDTVGVIGASASSNSGHLGARATAATFGGTSLVGKIGGQAIFSDTLMFTSSNPLATFADVSLNMALDGVLNAAANAAVGAHANARLEGRISIVNVFQFLIANDTAQGGSFILNDLELVGGVIGPTTNAQLRTSTFRVDLNFPVFFEMSIGAGAGAVDSGASADTDFSGSFKFPTVGDVFNLPNGVTVNAGTYLVNNHFIDPLAPPAGVPEPTSWALTVAGLGVAGAALRRRRALAA